MTASLIALVGFTAWTLLLVLVTGGYRIPMVLSGKRASDAWTRGRAVEDPPVIGRIGQAHLNCIENLPLFAALILVAAAAGHPEITNGLALWFLLARVGQSVAHIVSVHSKMIFFVRFPLFLVQVAILIIWMVALANLM